MFHSYIHELARSPVTTAVAAGMWDRSDFYVRLAFGSLYFSRTVKTAHQAIRAALVAGDAAELAVTAHLRAVGANIARQLAHRE